MKIDMKWVYGLMILLVAFVISMEFVNQKKISKLRNEILALQKRIDFQYDNTKVNEGFESYTFNEQKLCNKGIVPRLLRINEDGKFWYYDSYDVSESLDKAMKATFVGKIDAESRKVRFYVKERGEFRLKYRGYIYDWDKHGIVKGVETIDENFHIENCPKDE